MAGGGLLEPVGRDLEGQATDERGAVNDVELSQPGVREQARSDERKQDEDVPADDDAERAPKRPERQAERPGGRVELRLRLGAERVRIAPRIAAVLELVARQPEAVGGLEMVAWPGLAVAALAAGEEVRVRMPERGRRRKQRRDGAEEGCEP